MKLFGKRFWASALSALMLLSAMPVQAFALDDATLVTSSMAVESVVSSGERQRRTAGIGRCRNERCQFFRADLFCRADCFGRHCVGSDTGERA